MEQQMDLFGNEDLRPKVKRPARGFTYADGRRETERFADIVEQARLYILTDCGGSFERFAEWGLLRPLAQV